MFKLNTQFRNDFRLQQQISFSHKLIRSLNIFITTIEYIEIKKEYVNIMVGPKDGGFGFDGAPKYTQLERKNSICVQCQAGQHGKCHAKEDPKIVCDCELCMVS